jgi:hypothetical protein
MERNSDYPFAAGDVDWLGTIDPAELGEKPVLRFRGDASSSYLAYVYSVEPGWYEFNGQDHLRRLPDAGKPIPKPFHTVQRDARPNRHSSFGGGPPGGTDNTYRKGVINMTEIPVKEPSCLVFVRAVPQMIGPLLVWRRQDGTIVRAPSETSTQPDHLIIHLPLPDAPAELGAAKRESLVFEFYVDAPNRPAP